MEKRRIVLFGYLEVIKRVSKNNINVINIRLPEHFEQNFYKNTVNICEKNVVVSSAYQNNETVKFLIDSYEVNAETTFTNKFDGVGLLPLLHHKNLKTETISSLESFDIIYDKVNLSNARYKKWEDVLRFFGKLLATIILKPKSEGNNGVEKINFKGEIDNFFVNNNVRIEKNEAL